MKREFLQNFKVGEVALTKEIIDAIMDEAGRDVEEAKKAFGDYDTIKTQLAEAQKTIKGFETQDIEGIKQSAKDWEAKYNKAIEDHKTELDNRDFDAAIKAAVTAAKGRNEKAIRALLDVDTLKGSKDRAADITKAVEALKKDNDYLFETEDAPGYAPGTGSGKGGYSSSADAFLAAAGLKVEASK